MKKVWISITLIFILVSCSVSDSGTQDITLEPQTTPISTEQLATLTPTLTSTAHPTNTPLPPKQINFFHLRFEFTNTSDWATIEFINPEVVATMKSIEVTGNPQDATISSNVINLYRPLSEISKNPKATIVFDVAILPDKISLPFVILSKHGAINGSGLKIWRVTSENNLVLLREINHFWVDQKNPDTSAWKVTVDLSKLAQEEPNVAYLYQSADTPRMVWAFYYGWYMPKYSWMWWNNPKWTDRPIHNYNSSDPEIIRRQIEEAKSAGIDGFIYATPSLDDHDLIENFEIMLDVSEQLDFKVLSSIDLLLLNYGSDLKTTVLSNLREFFKSHYQHPAYMKINGKPVIQLYAVNKLPISDWEEIIATLKSEGFVGVFLTDSGTGDLSLFQGFYYYATNGISDLGKTYASSSQFINYYAVLSEVLEQKLWIATVQPGFDNSPITNDPVTPIFGQPPEIIDRENGDFYRHTWEAAISSDPVWIFITTWNEWQENTCIEPSQSYGDYYLQLTAEYVDKWKHE